jgi:Enterobacter phage Enc34, ssDNA-binding protein
MAEKEPRVVTKKTDHARFYSDGTILLMGVRVAYPHWAAPYEGKSDDGNAKKKFGCISLLPKTAEYRPTMRALSDRINEMLQENKVGAIKSDNKFLRNGDESGKDEYRGHWTVSASEDRRPTARLNRRDPKTGKPMKLDPEKDASVIYGGCWCNVLIRPWYMNNKYGKKINAGFSAIQFVRDDEAFGQGRISEDEVDEDFSEFMDDDSSGYDDDLDDDDEL